MRPSLSLMAESGRPSMVNRGKPPAVSASTRTRWASTPSRAAVRDVASTRWTSRFGKAAGEAARMRPTLGGGPAGRGPAVGSVGAAGVDGDRVAGGQPGAAQAPVPGAQVADGRV